MRINKYIKLSIGIVVIGLITLFSYNKISNRNEHGSKPIINIDNMISYTLDGKAMKEKPTKGGSYIVNKITCENGSNVIFDNTNWEAELIKIEKEDRCVIDFTSSTSTSGYRVTASPSIANSIDSLSKATINGGKVIFYSVGGYKITEVSGCNGTVKNNTVEVTNITSNQTCNITVQNPTP